VPAGGLSPDHTRWVRSRDKYFLPKEVLKKGFRGKFVDALQEAFQNGRLNFHADLKLLAQPKTFAAWLRLLCRKNWVVYLKPPFGGPEYVLQYLGRYTHRVAISNHRLVSFADGQVSFRWRDSAHHNEQSKRRTRNVCSPSTGHLQIDRGKRTVCRRGSVQLSAASRTFSRLYSIFQLRQSICQI
jgi:hypothetical protein